MRFLLKRLDELTAEVIDLPDERRRRVAFLARNLLTTGAPGVERDSDLSLVRAATLLFEVAELTAVAILCWEHDGNDRMAGIARGHLMDWLDDPDGHLVAELVTRNRSQYSDKIRM